MCITNKCNSAKQEAANGRGDAGKMEGTKKEKAGSKLSVERVYQKKTQLEHILLRPDTYIGSVEPTTQVSSTVDWGVPVRHALWLINTANFTRWQHVA